MRLEVSKADLAFAQNAFQGFPKRLAIKSYRIALNAGGGIFKKLTQANMPRRTGVLKQGIAVKVIIPDASYNSAHWGKPARMVVGSKRRYFSFLKRTAKGLRKRGKFTAIESTDVVARPTRYLHLVEKGTAGHTIKTAKKRALSNGQKTFGRSVKHPGTRGRHPLGQAFKAGAGAAKQKIAEKLREGASAVAADIKKTQLPSTGKA